MTDELFAMKHVIWQDDEMTLASHDTLMQITAVVKKPSMLHHLPRKQWKSSLTSSPYLDIEVSHVSVCAFITVARTPCMMVCMVHKLNKKKM